MYETQCIGEIEKDYQNTLSKCTQITYESYKKVKLSRKLIGFLLKALAPLM